MNRVKTKTVPNAYGLQTPNSWWETTLAEVCSGEGGSIQTGPFGSQLHAHDYCDVGTPVVMPKQLGDNVIVTDGIARILDKDVERLSRHKLNVGDIVFSRRGDVTRRAYITKEEEGWLCGTGCMLIRPSHPDVLNEYLAFFFSLPEFKKYITLNAVGATMPNLNTKILERIPLFLPSLAGQKKIVLMASAYDDLIENNARRIAILEEMAQSIYREWFVHFRFPGHQNVKLVDSTLGKIPEGWERKQLREIADTRLGKMLDAKKNKGDLMPYLANVNVRWGEFDLQDLREMRFEAKEHEKFGLRYGDIVMCEGGEPGRCAIWTEQVPNMMIQKAIHRIRSHEGVDFRFLYHTLRHKGQSGQLESLFTGATIKHLPSEKLKIVILEVPSTRLMGLFSQVIDPMISQVDVLTKRNSILRTTRDLLLPKLISGQLDVEDLDIDTGVDNEEPQEAFE